MGKEETMKKKLSLLGLALFFLFLLLIIGSTAEKERKWKEQTEVKIDGAGPQSMYVGVSQWLKEDLSEAERKELVKAFELKEKDIYTFLQGPRSWSEGIPWSGEWCQFHVKGNPFGGFGCGLCCMANIYDTLSPYEVSPLDMFEHARMASDYAPDGKYGAIDWEEMRCALKVCGVGSQIHRKPETYEEFQEQIRLAKSAIVLICSGNDDTYWQDTPGHYVNIWLYQKEDDTVFLAEPGSPENNRSRIPLRYIYDALKTASRFQYLSVSGYELEEDRWRLDGIEESWNRP